MSLVKMNDLNLKGKRVLIRADLNVPIRNKKVISDMRIRKSLATIQFALSRGAKVMLISHLGSPVEGKYSEEFSLFPVFDYLKKEFWNFKVRFVENYLDGIKIDFGELVVLENVRFNVGERVNSEILSRKYAALCDIFVMDAFASAHRMHASTCGVSCFAPVSCAGLLLSSELKSIEKVMKKPERPLVAIVGGSKVSTKFEVLRSLLKLADSVIVGGGIANTFIAIKNNVGKSLHEPESIKNAKKLCEDFNPIIPVDSRVGKEFSENAEAIVKKVSNIEDDEEIMDFGDKTIQNTISLLKNAKTILWNGPVGAFEFPNFRIGTENIAYAISNSNAFSIAGGGDTIAAIELFGIQDKISYISTGGGAFLKFIEGKKLPSIVMLEKRATI